MLPLAVTALEAMKTVPSKTWMIIGIALVVIIAASIILPKIFKMNKIVLGVIIMVTCSIVVLTWVKQRNEPAFLTPLIDWLAQYADVDVRYEKKDKKMPR